MDELVTKRLHVSGITPAITADDLSRRLGSFGTVTSLDGFGKRDALGQPRKFAYASLETTKGKLAKCMNLLSGSTWKGAKLRIGEAKPDFRERIALENAPPDDSPRPRKRARLARGVQGVHAPDMSLVTPANVHLHPKWHVTPLGRLIRPVRMRPSRPLDPPLDQAKDARKGTSKGKEKEKAGRARKRKRAREPPVRARRRAIDPMRWGSTQVKGAFLEGEVAGARVDTVGDPYPTDGEEDDEDADEGQDELGRASSDRDDDKVDVATVLPEENAPRPSQAPSAPQPLPPSPPPSLPPPHRAPNTSSNDNDLVAEKSRTLDFLKDLFGAADPERDWGAAEDLSDVDMDAEARRTSDGDAADEDAFEVVPRAAPTAKIRAASAGADEGSAEDDEGSADVASPASDADESAASLPAQQNKLKDLFAPREDEGFSLLGHLDLDLDLELDDPASLPQPSIAHRAPPALLPAPPPIPTSHLPPFFPTSTTTGRARNILEVLRDIGGEFRREDDEGRRRARWETAKSELTGEWKRRHREAVKVQKRRGRGAGDGAQ
ncbi:hypothetical protein OF83DRAFT_721244 [Amylostereum chailletii]|nr:hypothetical protein OF83DRAFT_721244 [Amylostereum chailletii]